MSNKVKKYRVFYKEDEFKKLLDLKKKLEKEKDQRGLDRMCSELFSKA